MTEIVYMIGDATSPQGTGNKIICHLCNDVGAWGKGFVLALSKCWSQPEAAYRRWFEAKSENDFALGAVQFVQVAPEIAVANLIGQRDIQRTSGGQPPIRYEAVETGLARIAEMANERHASVHMPRIGCGLAGGTWGRIEPVIQRTLCTQDVQVFVYDLA